MGNPRMVQILRITFLKVQTEDIAVTVANPRTSVYLTYFMWFDR